jgi:cytochrome c oxidase subunit 4
MADHGTHGNDAHGGGHAAGEFGHGGVGKYIAVFVGLCILTAISFGIANSPLKNTPEITWVMMMAVSCAKAMLVILFFMHLKWEANWKYVLTIPASIMSIFLLLMLVPDVGLRGRHYSEERRLHAAEPYSAAGQHAPGDSAETKPAEKKAGH